VALTVMARRGGKASEDIVVPLDRLGEAIEETLAIGRRHDLAACSWGHAGDGNLHSTFLVAPEREDELARAAAAAQELFALAVRLGGSISGEHGVGWVKRGQLARQWSPHAVALHEGIKRVFDPKGLFNPGKKVAAPV
jgi:FAD/FMN-containing dehydrogenase